MSATSSVDASDSEKEGDKIEEVDNNNLLKVQADNVSQVSKASSRRGKFGQTRSNARLLDDLGDLTQLEKKSAKSEDKKWPK